MRVAGFVLWMGWALAVSGQPLERIWEPSLAYSQSLSDRHSLSAQVNAFQGTERLERIEGSLFLNRRLTVRTAVSAGYLLRVGTPLEATRAIENRLTGQVSHTLSAGIHQLSYRGRLEWRMRDSGDVLRARIRVSMRTPLQGDRLDPGETYLLLQNELLGSWAMESGDRAADNRLSAHMGWLLRNRQRVEIGLQHRWEDIGLAGDTHVMLLGTTWHFTR